MNRSIILFLAILTSLVAAGCGGGRDRAPDGRLRVVATTGQVGDVARHVGGDRVHVDVLMGPGLDPHLYKASAGDVERLRQADVIFYNGLHLEAKMGDVIERMGEHRPTLGVAESLPDSALIAAADSRGAHDPHVWFDVRLWRHTVDAVAGELAALDPDHAAAYRARADAYRAELDSLDAYARARFGTIPPGQRVLITAHDAFNYLGRAYGLEVRGLQGISTATEAGTADVQSLARLIAERRIPAIFVETSVSPRAIEAVRQAVRARGFDVVVGGEVYSDALGDAGTPAGTYVGMVRHNVDIITAALRGEGAAHEQH